MKPCGVGIEMRKRALGQSATREGHFWCAGGFRFGLSHGRMSTPSREDFDRHYRDLMLRLGQIQIETTYEEFVTRYELSEIAGAGRSTWIFSASLIPRGRAANPQDWLYLQKMAIAIGAPPESMRTSFEEAPQAVQYWVWDEDTSKVS